MLTFFITTDQRRRAQGRAAELDINRSDPPGKYPCLWDNRQNSVKRWYDYRSSLNKIGTVYFEPGAPVGDLSRSRVRCSTEITYRVSGQNDVWRFNDDDRLAHEVLKELFYRELLLAPRDEGD